MIRVLPERATIAVMSLEARPVTVMQPAMTPAIEQATATVMVPAAAGLESLKELRRGQTAVLIDNADNDRRDDGQGRRLRMV